MRVCVCAYPEVPCLLPDGVAAACLVHAAWLPRPDQPLPSPWRSSPAAPTPQAEEERKRVLEEKRLEAARMVLAGKSILVRWGDDDPFGNMSPEVSVPPVPSFLSLACAIP